MRIGIVFHKDPYAPPKGIDLVRLRAIAGGLAARGHDCCILAPGAATGRLDGTIPVRPLPVTSHPDRYDLLKACYHFSADLVNGYSGPVVFRIVRVVDEHLPERDEPFRATLLRCQEIIRQRASLLVLNNEENLRRWRQLYGAKPDIAIVPTGCPSTIPPSGPSPFEPGERAVLFLGSLAAPRMVRLLNEAARRLNGLASVHLVGLNKSALYGSDKLCRLDPLVADHGEMPENLVWDYVRHASIGLAFATGPHPFDNDVSKIINYLRGGLPVLSEDPIINNSLVQTTGLGRTFRFDDPDHMVEQALSLLCTPPESREAVMDFMALEHSWERRVETYERLFQSLLWNQGTGK